MLKIGQTVKVKLYGDKIFTSTILAEPQELCKGSYVLIKGLGLIDVKMVEVVEEEYSA